MENRFWNYILALAVVILALVFWLRPIRPPANPEPASMAQPTNNVPTSPATVARVASQSVLGTAPVIASPATPKPSTANGMGIAGLVSKFVEGKNAPVEFYGLVIDQDSNALAGVNVKVSVQQLTAPNPTAMELGATEVPFERITGPDGRFEISGLKGESLDLASIQKDGYEAEPTKRGFGTSSGSVEQPVVFKMWSNKIHEKLISGGKSFDIVPDGRPYFINLTDDTISESGEGDLKVWIQYTNQPVRGQLYDWSAGIEVLKGGLLEESLGSAMFEAPIEGYVSSFHLSGQIKGGQRGDIGERQFYLKLKNGQEYGQMSIGLYAPFNDQIPGLIRLSYTINPSGSAILR
jgi:hypothetical protein